MGRSVAPVRAAVMSLSTVLSSLPPVHVPPALEPDSDTAGGGGKRRAAPSLLAFSLDRSELLRYDAINGRLLVSNISRDPDQVTVRESLFGLCVSVCVCVCESV